MYIVPKIFKRNCYPKIATLTPSLGSDGSRFIGNQGVVPEFHHPDGTDSCLNSVSSLSMLVASRVDATTSAAEAVAAFAVQ